MTARFALAFGVLFGVAGCAAESMPGDDFGSTGDTLTWEEFLAEHVVREPFEDGVFIVDGDLPIDSEKRLFDFYENLIDPNALAVARGTRGDQVWSASEKLNITYCVSSTSFGSRYNQVVQAMASATGAWEAVANVDFRHVVAEDGRCDQRNTAVVFDVRGTSGAGYLARAFFPGQGRSSRNVIIDSSSFSSRVPNVEGILRHELGHTLGFRHEHTRPEAGRCFEDNNWRGVTSYDRNSVMHYPQCGGTNNPLTISSLDAQGAASIYGAPGANPNPTPNPNPNPTPTPTPGTGTPRAAQSSGSLTAGQQAAFQPLTVKAGTTLRASITGTGDVDLYVRFGSAPTTSAYTCRPYRSDANETCELLVPDGTTQAFVMVRGYTASTYQLDVSWTEP